MSIGIRSNKKYISYCVIGAAVWVFAVNVAWQHSRPGGGDQSRPAQDILRQVSETTRLTPACFMLAGKLAEAGLKAKAATWFPSADYLTGKETVAAEHYAAGRCPTSALLGISYGIADAANSHERALQKNRAVRWQ